MTESTTLVLLTNGVRRDCIEQTIASADQALPDVTHRLIAADTAEPETLSWLGRFGWDVRPIPRGRRREIVYVGKRRGLIRLRRKGYSAAVAGAIRLALDTSSPWIFWLEDDFTFNEPVDLAAMQAVLREHPHVAQMALVRQPWYPYEVEAGSLMAVAPEAYEQRDGWIEHRRWFTMNPMLTRREVLADTDWPQGVESEMAFGERLRADPAVTFGLWGSLDDPPRVHHLGDARAGRSY